MKRIVFFAVILSAVFLFTGCMSEKSAPQGASSSVQKISAEEGKKMLDEGGVMLVDVRTAAEYAEKHIAGALLLPNEEIGSETPPSLPDLNAKIIVYCRSGRRSAEAAQKLSELGYTHLYDMGGINSWPYETVAGEAAA